MNSQFPSQIVPEVFWIKSVAVFQMFRTHNLTSIDLFLFTFHLFVKMLWISEK